MAVVDPTATASGPKGEPGPAFPPGAWRGLRGRVALAALVVGAVVAAVFALLVVAIVDLRDATRASDRAGQIVLVMRDIQELMLDAERATRGFAVAGDETLLAPLRGARRRFPARAQAVRDALGPRSSSSAGEAQQIIGAVDRYLRSAGRLVAVARLGRRATRDVESLDAALDVLIATQRRALREGQRAAEGQARTALGLAVGGIVASGVLFALYAAYVTRRIVVPVRRVGATARELATGTGHARVRDARSMRGEMGEMARSFNAMADALEHTRAELEAQNAELEAQGGALREQRGELESYAAELEAQRGELELTLGQLEAEKARMDVSFGFGQMVAAETRFKPLADFILMSVADNADAEVGLLYVRDAKRDHALALASTRGVEVGDVPERIEPGVGPAGRAASEGRSVAAGPRPDALRLRVAGAELAVRHELHVPLVQSGAVFGVLTLARLSEPEFSPAERELVAHLADQSAVALAKVVALRDAARREAITSAVLDAAPNAIGLFDDAGRAVLANGHMTDVMAGWGEGSVAADVAAGADVVRDEISPPGSGRVFARHTARLDEEQDTARGRLVVLRDVTASRSSPTSCARR